MTTPDPPHGTQLRDAGAVGPAARLATPPARSAGRTGRTVPRLLIAAALPVGGVVVAVAGWQLATIIFDIRQIILPAPSNIVDAFRRLPEHLLRQSWSTLWVTLVGFALAALGGVAVAILLTSSRFLHRAVMPLVVALNSVPKVAVVPLLIFWLGRGPEPKVVLVILICFFPVVVSTMAGLTSTPADLGELTRSLSASRWQTFAKVRFPWALPQIFVGLKVAMPLAMIGAVVSEISNPNSGLGSVIVRSGASLDTPLAFAAIVLLAIMSVTLFYLVVGAERLLLPWVRQTTSG